MLTGKIVKLRSYKKEDIPVVYEYINDPETKRYLMPGIPFPMKLEDEEKWYDKINAFSTTNFTFAIESLETGEYIGGCGINEIDWKNSWCVVGIFLGKNFTGKGYGTDAMDTLLSFIFNEMNINKVKLNVYDFNKRAIRSYEKSGFRTDGVLRQEIYREGKHHDEVVMSILKEEFFNK